MEERKWTPGPWIVTAAPDLSLFVCEENHNIIATIGTCNTSDAHLIAAAPDLYDALVDILDIGDFNLDCDGKFTQKARAALSKAKGEKHNES